MSEAKFQTIYHDLKEKILAGELQAGDRLPTEKQLAQQYGVAVLTLRQAIRLLREEKLVESRRYHGTVVTGGNWVDSGVRGKIGMVVPIGLSILRHPVFSRLVDGVEGVLAERGYTLEFVVSNPDNGVAEKALKRAVEESDVRGWVVPTGLSSEAKEWIRGKGKPKVSFHLQDDLFSPHLFLLDFTNMAFTLLDHLYEQGYRNVWAVGPKSMQKWMDLLVRAGRDRNRYPELRLRSAESTDFSMAVGASIAHEILSGHAVDAFVCADDELAVGVYQAVEERSLTIPEIGVVGGGDFPMGGRIHPALTTVSYPYYQIGREGTALLMDLLDEKLVEPAHRYFLPRLLIRESSVRHGQSGMNRPGRQDVETL